MKKLLNLAKRSMIWFWEDKEISRERLCITNVSIEPGKEEYILTITLERPGYIIGKGGKDINALTERLTKDLKHPVKIVLIEDKQWSKIYSEEDDLPESRLPKRILTEKEVKEKFEHHLTVGDLKKSIELYNIPDEAKVVIQRIEDVYFKRHGWGVMLKEGEHYHNTIQMNKNMREEIARRERGEEPDYSKIEDPNQFILEDENILRELKEQYIPAWCVVGYEDKDFLFIDLHY